MEFEHIAPFLDSRPTCPVLETFKHQESRYKSNFFPLQCIFAQPWVSANLESPGVSLEEPSSHRWDVTARRLTCVYACSFSNIAFQSLWWALFSISSQLCFLTWLDISLTFMNLVRKYHFRADEIQSSRIKLSPSSSPLFPGTDFWKAVRVFQHACGCSQGPIVCLHLHRGGDKVKMTEALQFRQEVLPFDPEMESKVTRKTVKKTRGFDLCTPSVLAHRPFQGGISLFFFF